MTLSTLTTRRRQPLILLAALALAACKSDVTQPASSSAPLGSNISFQAGVDQTGAAGHPLRTPVEVEVNTENGGVDSIVVSFVVASGGGSVSPASVRTDGNGNAATIWTLGPTVGLQTINVIVQVAGGSPLTAVDSATAVPNVAGPPSVLAIHSGDMQQGSAGQQLAQPLIVAVTDSFGIGIPGITVAFTSGGTSQIIGGVAGNGQPVTTAATLTTDANGQAAVPYQLGSGLGIYSVQAQATLSGTLSTVFFTATAQNGNGTDQAAVADIFVGKGPQGIALNPTTGTIYVANTGQQLSCDFAPTLAGGLNSYSSVSGTTDGLLVTQQTTTDPFYATPNPATNTLYVAGTPSLEVWNAANNTRITTLTLNDSLRQIAINAATNQIWVAASLSHSAILINGATNQVTATIPTGEQGPHGIALNATTNRVYTTDASSQTVTVIDGVAHTVITHIPISGPAMGIAIDSVTNHIFVSTGSAQASLVVIDGSTNSVIATISAQGRRLGEVAVDPTGNRVYVASASLPYSIAVFDGAANVLIGFHPTATRCPYGVAFDQALKRVYVTSYVDNNLFVLDATKLP